MGKLTEVMDKGWSERGVGAGSRKDCGDGPHWGGQHMDWGCLLPLLLTLTRFWSNLPNGLQTLASS